MNREDQFIVKWPLDETDQVFDAEPLEFAIGQPLPEIIIGEAGQRDDPNRVNVAAGATIHELTDAGTCRVFAFEIVVLHDAQVDPTARGTLFAEAIRLPIQGQARSWVFAGALLTLPAVRKDAEGFGHGSPLTDANDLVD